MIGFNPKLELETDILESFEVKGERIFTFRLREGHRWSDGSEFTTEDFRYVWEDMFLNKKLYKGGIPASSRWMARRRSSKSGSPDGTLYLGGSQSRFLQTSHLPRRRG